MRLSCYWQWISSQHYQSSLRIHSYFDDVMAHENCTTKDCVLSSHMTIGNIGDGSFGDEKTSRKGEFSKVFIRYSLQSIRHWLIRCQLEPRKVQDNFVRLSQRLPFGTLTYSVFLEVFAENLTFSFKYEVCLVIVIGPSGVQFREWSRE